MGEPQKAETNARKAIEIFSEVYTSPHVRKAVAHMALGDALMSQGKHKEALAAYLRAEEIFDHIAPTHKGYDDLSELYEKIVTACIPIRDGNNVDLYAKKHLAAFEATHFRYIRIANKRLDAEI